MMLNSLPLKVEDRESHCLPLPSILGVRELSGATKGIRFWFEQRPEGY
jgi:hypothetical protein